MISFSSLVTWHMKENTGFEIYRLRFYFYLNLALPLWRKVQFLVVYTRKKSRVIQHLELKIRVNGWEGINDLIYFVHAFD